MTERLLLEDRPVANEQKKANRIMELIGGVSLVSMVAAVAYMAQQFQNVEIALKSAKEVSEQTRQYQRQAIRSMGDLDKEVGQLSVKIQEVARDVEYNRTNIDKIRDRVEK